MADVERIDVKEARRHVASARALLVCVYDDEARCHRLGLEGSIDLAQFRRLAPMLPEDREIIFYCA